MLDSTISYWFICWILLTPQLCESSILSEMLSYSDFSEMDSIFSICGSLSLILLNFNLLILQCGLETFSTLHLFFFFLFYFFTLSNRMFLELSTKLLVFCRFGSRRSLLTTLLSKCSLSFCPWFYFWVSIWLSVWFLLSELLLELDKPQ